MKSFDKKNEVEMQKNLVEIHSEKDFLHFLDNIDNLEYLHSNRFQCDNVEVVLKLEGDAFESSLTGSIITGLADYQQKLYHIYRTDKYGIGSQKRLNAAEHRLFEIKVTVKPGCTEIVVALINKLPEVLKLMTGGQVQATIITTVGIVSAAWMLKGALSQRVTQKITEKRRALAAKRMIATDEKEKQQYECIGSVVHDALEGMRSVCGGIISSQAKTVSIDNNKIPVSELSSIMDSYKQDKPEVVDEQSVVSGMYRIKKKTLNFQGDSASADVFDAKTGDPIDGLILQPKSIYDGSYGMLKHAYDKHDFNLQIIITQRNGRIYRAVLDKILEAD
jgi:hypothetical protein